MSIREPFQAAAQSSPSPSLSAHLLRRRLWARLFSRRPLVPLSHEEHRRRRLLELEMQERQAQAAALAWSLRGPV